MGLLDASARSPSGYRLYARSDVERLYRILALRRFGLSLQQIRRTLDDGAADPRELMRRHVAELDERIRQEQRLRQQLSLILDALDTSSAPDTEQFIDAMGRMTMIEQSSRRARRAARAPGGRRSGGCRSGRSGGVVHRSSARHRGRGALSLSRVG
jgi:DNA-binding transcriptional MerR regulator